MQARYYLLGDFRHGMQVGAEFLYGWDVYKQPSMSVRFPQPAVFAGYKYTSRGGFTVDGQLGVRRQGETLVAGSSRIEKKAKVLPMLNLNLGWSF